MKLTKQEQETIVLFNEAESTAEIYTYNTKLQNRLKKFERVCTAQINLREDDTGAVTATVPKNLLTISVRAPYSEQERQARSERAKQGSNLQRIPPSSCEFEEIRA